MLIGRNNKAFSLIELVIVIIILGIIAAIAIPRIGAANASAAESAIRANLASLRNAIGQYYLTHDGTLLTVAVLVDSGKITVLRTTVLGAAAP